MGAAHQDILARLPSLESGLAIASPLAAGFIGARSLEATSSASARASEINARLERERGDLEAKQIRSAARRTSGRNRLAIAASGVQAQGTPMQFLLDQALEAERSAFQAQLAARRSAELDVSRARAERKRGRSLSAAALLTGGARALGTGLQLRREGAF